MNKDSDNVILASPFDEIEKLVGYCNAVAIAQHLGFGWVYIPSVDTLLRDHRYKQIIQDHKKGLRIRDIARKNQVSDGTVRNYIRKYQASKSDNVPLK